MDEAIEAAILILILSGFGLSWFSGSDAPFIPTPLKDLDKVLKDSGLKRGTVFYELGSGDGRVVIKAAQMGADSNGVEQSWLRVFYSRFQSKKLNLKNTHFFHGNIFDRHYYPADVVYIYMLQKCVNKLEKLLKKELKKGAIVITQRYHFKHWKPFKKTEDYWYYKA